MNEKQALEAVERLSKTGKTICIDSETINYLLDVAETLAKSVRLYREALEKVKGQWHMDLSNDQIVEIAERALAAAE